jgi:hypothetical protein
MNEDFIPYELALKLKEKGFDIPFYFYYRTDDKYLHHAMVTKPLVYCDKIDDEVVCAPTISQVLKWLREEKRIDAGAVWDNRDGKWIGYINEMDMPDLVGEYVLPNTYDTYEQAALAGIEYVLENLI